MEETMVLDNEILVCDEPEYCNSLDSTVEYFVVCKKGQQIGSKEAYDCKIAGEKVASWVARACENAKVLEINDYQDEIEAVLANLSHAEYTVILRGNIPLINKQHLKNIIGYVMLNNMNACKLKGGYVFKTEYLLDVGKVVSADTYNLKTNDFFAVENFDSLEFARSEIAKRILNYHSKNGVNFENGQTNIIDANVQIENGCKIAAGTQILKNSKVCADSKILKNSIISSSLIKEDCEVDENVFIKNSTIGANVKIAAGVIIENCKIANGCVIMTGSRLINSEIGMGVKINPLCDIVSSKVLANAEIGTMSRLFNANIEEGYDLFDGKIIINRPEEN